MDKSDKFISTQKGGFSFEFLNFNFCSQMLTKIIENEKYWLVKKIAECANN